MDAHFSAFREGIIGQQADIPVPGGQTKRVIYADWTASGRNYLPIEKRIQEEIMPLVANTHTETSSTGMAMTHAYHKAREIIKQHVNAGPNDILITATSGMTRLVNKLQRILGVKTHSKYTSPPPEHQRPVVFITHMEHHSNQTSWLETFATVEIINATSEGLVDLDHLRSLAEQYRDRSLKIASVTACSNVTGIITPYHEMAKIIHSVGGFCFVDFACSAPYVAIDMHPKDASEQLDAIIFSPHKFLGGPGSAGVLIFNNKLYNTTVPDNPGGGTVDWTNPWGEHKYVDDIEAREDGGTPAFLQTIKTSMCIRLKEEMNPLMMQEREHLLVKRLWSKLEGVPNLHILAPQHKERLAVFSFYIEGLHYNLGVRLLNDKFGIQTRGGCSCAGTYGHYLLNVDPAQSKAITERINVGDFSTKPGWIRASLHPTMTDEEVDFIADAIAALAKHHSEWSADYLLDPSCSGYTTSEDSADDQIKKRIDHALGDSFLTSS